MSRRVSPIVAALLPCSLSLLGSPAAAEDAAAEPPAVQVLLKNTPEGALFSVEGTCTPLPDGTRLTIVLRAKGPAKDVVCALFRVRVKENTYAGERRWKRQTLAPMSYDVQVRLNVDKQQHSTRTWIMQQYGFPQGHKELLDSRLVGVGTPQERAEFARANLQRMIDFGGELEVLRREMAAAFEVPAAENPEWKTQVKELNARVIGLRREFDGYSRGYVVLLEKGFLGRLLSALKVLGSALFHHAMAKDDPVQEVAALEADLALLIRQIRAQMPARADGTPLVHPDAEAAAGSATPPSDDAAESEDGGEAEGE